MICFPRVSSPNPSVYVFPRILTDSTSVSFCTVKLKFLYSTVSSLKSIVGMVAKTSPSFRSCCPCWTSASVLGCIGTGWLQLSSVMCFASYFALSRSQPAVGYFLVLPAVGFALLPAVGFALLSSFHHCSRSSTYQCGLKNTLYREPYSLVFQVLFASYHFKLLV